MRSDQRDRQVTRIGVTSEFAAAAHRGQAVAKQPEPPFITSSQVGQDVTIGFKQLTCQ